MPYIQYSYKPTGFLVSTEKLMDNDDDFYTGDSDISSDDANLYGFHSNDNGGYMVTYAKDQISEEDYDKPTIRKRKREEETDGKEVKKRNISTQPGGTIGLPESLFIQLPPDLTGNESNLVVKEEYEVNEYIHDKDITPIKLIRTTSAYNKEQLLNQPDDDIIEIEDDLMYTQTFVDEDAEYKVLTPTKYDDSDEDVEMKDSLKKWVIKNGKKIEKKMDVPKKLVKKM